MAPPRRPPLNHTFVDDTWVHITGGKYDVNAHANFMRERKRNCTKRWYWERGGRDQRLRQYVHKRHNLKQMTLFDPTLQSATLLTTRCAQTT